MSRKWYLQYFAMASCATIRYRIEKSSISPIFKLINIIHFYYSLIICSVLKILHNARDDIMICST
jgi:hypothetical protein